MGELAAGGLHRRVLFEGMRVVIDEAPELAFMREFMGERAPTILGNMSRFGTDLVPMRFGNAEGVSYYPGSASWSDEALINLRLAPIADGLTDPYVFKMKTAYRGPEQGIYEGNWPAIFHGDRLVSTFSGETLAACLMLLTDWRPGQDVRLEMIQPHGAIATAMASALRANIAVPNGQPATIATATSGRLFQRKVVDMEGGVVSEPWRITRRPGASGKNVRRFRGREENLRHRVLTEGLIAVVSDSFDKTYRQWSPADFTVVARYGAYATPMWFGEQAGVEFREPDSQFWAQQATRYKRMSPVDDGLNDPFVVSIPHSSLVREDVRSREDEGYQPSIRRGEERDVLTGYGLASCIRAFTKWTPGQHVRLQIPSLGLGNVPDTVAAELRTTVSAPMGSLTQVGAPDGKGRTKFDLIVVEPGTERAAKGIAGAPVAQPWRRVTPPTVSGGRVVPLFR